MIFERKSVGSVLEDPRDDEFYVLTTRYYPYEMRREGIKFEESPFDVWDRELAPSEDLLNRFNNRELIEKEYIQAFIDEKGFDHIFGRYHTHILSIRDQKKIVFCCIEEDQEFCHTHILVDLAKIFKKIYFHSDIKKRRIE